MKNEDHDIDTIQLFMDGELKGKDLESMIAHLDGCAACRQILDEEKLLSERIRRTRPQVQAPTALRERILRDMNGTARQADVPRVASPAHTRFSDYSWRSLVAAALLCVAVSGVFLVSHFRHRAYSRAFIEAAIATHRNFGDDAFLSVRSSSPEVVASWFAQRVAFPFRMPNTGIASDDRAKYKLTGGRIVDFAGERAALLVFKMSNNRISLLVASDKLAKATGGKINYSNGMVFHARDMDNLHVATWDNKGLTYALVSSAAMGSKGSCSTCHNDSPGLLPN